MRSVQQQAEARLGRGKGHVACLKALQIIPVFPYLPALYARRRTMQVHATINRTELNIAEPAKPAICPSSNALSAHFNSKVVREVMFDFVQLSHQGTEQLPPRLPLCNRSSRPATMLPPRVAAFFNAVRRSRPKLTQTFVIWRHWHALLLANLPPRANVTRLPAPE